MVVTSPDGGYRDLAAQQYRYENPEGPVSIAPPGSSTHGWGTAIDIWNRQYGWLVSNAGRFGFTQTFDNEPWHWQYNGALTPGNGAFLMALSDAEQAELLSLMRNIAGYLYAGGASVTAGRPGIDFAPKSTIGRLNTLEAAVFYGGTSMQDDGKSISQSLAEIHDEVRP